MGSCCGCGIKVDPVDDKLVQQPLKEYHANSNSRVVQLTEQSSKQMVEEVIEMMTVSFAGSTTSAPEGNISWVLDPKASGDDPSLPLLEDPSEERLEHCQFVIRFIMKVCLPQRSCFALIKEGKVVSAALCLPPSTKEFLAMNPMYRMYMALSFGLPQSMKSKSIRDRGEAMGALMKEAHETWASSPHWYVFAFASDAKEQGKGYGREMMGFITNLADKSGHPMYLETFGPRNERFYSRNGFEVKQRMVYKTEHESMDKHGGAAVMLRAANMEG